MKVLAKVIAEFSAVLHVSTDLHPVLSVIKTFISIIVSFGNFNC